MIFVSELIYFLSLDKSEKTIRKLLRKTPKWSRGHLLLSQRSKTEQVKQISTQAISVLNKKKAT